MSSSACVGSYYCVCCMSTDDLGLFIGPERSYADMLKTIFMVKVLPTATDSHICGECTGRLSDASQFKVQVLESIRALRVHGLIKTRKCKGGYLLVKTIQDEEKIADNEYYTEVLDESLLETCETFSNTLEIEVSDNVEEEESKIVLGLGSIDNFTSEGSVNREAADIIHNVTEDREAVFKQSSNVCESSSLSQTIKKDFSNIGLQDIVYSYNIKTDEHKGHGINEVENFIENIATSKRLEEVKLIREVLHSDEVSQNKVNEDSTLIFHEVEHVIEVIDQDLEDFEHSPCNFEEIEICSGDSDQHFSPLLNISNSAKTLVDVNEKIKTSDINSPGPNPTPNIEPIKKSTVPKRLRQQTLIKPGLTAGDIRKISKSESKEYVGSKTLDVILHERRIPNPNEEFGRTISSILITDITVDQISAEKINIPFDARPNDKRITFNRSRRRKPKTAKPKEAPLYSVTADLRCEHCGERLPNLRMFHRHMNVHFPNHLCGACGRAFLSEKRLKRHAASHETGPFTCACGEHFTNYNTMNSHRRRKHSDVKPYRCTECAERFPTYHRRAIHLAEQHGQDERRYKCHLCTKRFMISGNLSAHVRRVHLHVKRHTCDRCGAGYFLRQELAAHLARHERRGRRGAAAAGGDVSTDT